MADIISRIVLQAQGGDQVAAEYRKITRAASEAARASQGIGTGGGGGAGGDWSAFSRATQSDAGAHTAARESRNNDYLGRLGERTRQHQTLETQNRGVSAGVFRTINQASAAVSQAGQGDPVGGAGGLIQGVAAKMGPWGIAIAAAVGAGLATNKLAEKDLDLRKQVWSGIGQRLNEQNFETFRPKLRALETAGFTESTLPFYQMLASAGGKALSPADAQNLLRMQYATGIDTGTLAQFTARFQQAGAGTGLVTSRWTGFQAENAFGRGQMGLFYETISSAVEDAMGRGFTKGSSAFTNAYTSMVQKLADLAIYGKLTPQGAVATFQAVQKSVAGAAAGPKRPEDVMQFMMFRKPGESYIDTIKRMTEPGADEAIYANLRALAGGDRTALIQMVMSQFGFADYRQAEAFIAGSDKRLQLREAAARGATYQAPPDYQVDEETLRRRAASATRKTLLEKWGVTEAGGAILRAVTEFFSGGPTDPVKEELKNILSNSVKRSNAKGYGTTYGSMVEAVQGKGQGFISLLPAEMQSFAKMALDPNLQVQRAGNPIFEQMLPLMAMYEQWTQKKISVSPAEEKMLQKFGPAFAGIKSLFSEYGASMATPENMNALEQAIFKADDENRDALKQNYTIVDILRALEMHLGVQVLTDTGTTEE